MAKNWFKSPEILKNPRNFNAFYLFSAIFSRFNWFNWFNELRLCMYCVEVLAARVSIYEPPVFPWQVVRKARQLVFGLCELVKVAAPPENNDKKAYRVWIPARFITLISNPVSDLRNFDLNTVETLETGHFSKNPKFSVLTHNNRFSRKLTVLAKFRVREWAKMKKDGFVKEKD